MSLSGPGVLSDSKPSGFVDRVSCECLGAFPSIDIIASWACAATAIENGDGNEGSSELDRVEMLADEQDKICEQGAAVFLSCETRGSGSRSGEFRVEQRMG